MEKLLGQVKQAAVTALKQPKVRKNLIRGVAVLLVLQVYFVRELIAAEALFVLGFIAVMAIVGICYGLGSLGLKSIDLTETGVRFAGHSARRSYGALEVMARNSIRHLPSETAK